jgi:hypothetical protein
MYHKSRFAVMEFGRNLADVCARVNWRHIEAVEEEPAEELAQKLTEKIASLKAERKRKSYDTDTVYTIGAEDLRTLLCERGIEPELIDYLLRTMELSFKFRLQEARDGRRKVEASVKKVLGWAAKTISQGHPRPHRQP